MSSLLIETPRLRLRPFEKRDAEAFCAYRQDPEIARYQSWDVGYSYSDARDFISAIAEAKLGAAGKWFQVAIADLSTDALLGDIGVYFDEGGKERVTIGFTLSPGAQGKGLATEALRALFSHLGQEFATHKIEALTDVRNTPTQRLLERLGFSRIQTIQKSGFYKGEWCDEILYEKIASK